MNGLPTIFNAEIVRAIRIGVDAGHMLRRAVGRETHRGAALVNQRKRDSRRRALAMVREDMRIDRRLSPPL